MSLYAGKGKCCMWHVNKVEIHFAKIGCKWSNSNAPGSYSIPLGLIHFWGTKRGVHFTVYWKREICSPYPIEYQILGTTSCFLGRHLRNCVVIRQEFSVRWHSRQFIHVYEILLRPESLPSKTKALVYFRWARDSGVPRRTTTTSAALWP